MSEETITKTETNVKELKINILSQEQFDQAYNNGEINQNEIYMTPGQKVPTKTSELENDAGYLTEHQDISGKLDKTGDASNTTASFTAALTRTNLTSGEKLSVSLGKIAKYFADLKTVVFTGSYNDLSDKPSIPTITNDLTNELKANYDTAYQHSTEPHAPANAQENIIEEIKVNGTAQTVTNKSVNIPVPDAYSHPTFTSYASGLYKIGTTEEGHVTSVTPVTKEDITALGIPAQDTDTIYVHPTYNDQALGLYRIQVTGGHVKSVTAVTKADITALGIPAQDTVYTHPTYTPQSIGLYKFSIDSTGHVNSVSTITKDDITGLGIPAQDTVYTHPTNIDALSGLYKVTISNGHVTAVSAVTKSDITGLGIPAQDTTYGEVTQTTNGLMLSNDKVKLDSIETGANKTIIDSVLSDTSTNPVQNKVVKSGLDAVNSRIDAITDGADAALDTFKEVKEYLDNHQAEYEALAAISSNKVDKVDGKGLSTNDYTDEEKTKLAGISSGAEVNQNAFSNIVIGTSTIAADNKTDSLTLEAGENIELTADAVNDKVIIKANVPTKISELENDSGYKTTDNNTTYSISKTGNTVVLKGSDGSESSFTDSDTTYSDATTSTSGLMSPSDKEKINGISAGAEVNQNAFSSMNVDGTAIDSSSKTDTFSFVSGSNIELTPDVVNKKITIKANIPTNVSDLNNDAGYLTEHQDISGKLDKTGDGSEVTSAFTTATERTALSSGDKLSILFGKIAKYFSDLGSLAFKSTVQKSDLESSIQTTLDSVVVMTDEEINAICV